MKFIPFIAVFMSLVSTSLAGVDIYSQIQVTPFETLMPNEHQQVASFLKIITAMQTNKVAVNGEMKRAFHAKSHGCLKGELNVLPLPQSLAKGLFSTPLKSYPVVARFSNGVGFIQKDSNGDVKGLALKVSNVPGESLLDVPELANKHVQDFTMTNNPTPLADNVSQFVDFGVAMDKGRPYGIAFLLKNLKIAKIVLERVFFRTVQTLTNETFWSGSPYLLGRDLAVKWKIKPCNESAAEPANLKDPNYLRTELQNQINHHNLCYVLSAQRQLDPIKQPIEQHLTEWKEEDTPSIPLATVIFPKELNARIADNDSACEALNFNPWNGLKEHQPLGNMNRARGQIYLNSFLNRQNFNQKNNSK